MTFPIHDSYWLESAIFIFHHWRTDHSLLAPEEFQEKFGRSFSYASTFIEPSHDFEWVIIHKGRVEDLAPDFLDRLFEHHFPVFANEVFAIFSNLSELEAQRLEREYLHLQSLWEAIEKLTINGDRSFSLEKSQQNLSEAAAFPDYSSLSLNQIKDLMNKRYDDGNAYTISLLWDQVRLEEISRYVTRFVLPSDEKSILELGCGLGGSADHISKCREFVGTDLSESAVRQANLAYGHRPNFRFRAMDAMNLDFSDNRFDIVIAREVLEHLPNPQKCIREVYRVLKPGGAFVLTSPNRDSLHLRVNRKLGYEDFKCSYDHIKELTFQEAVTSLQQEGFSITDTGGIFLMPYWGIPNIDSPVRSLTDNDPELVDTLRELGQRVGAEYAFCFAIAALK